MYNTSFTVAATASSGLPVDYTATGVCTNSGATFTMTSGVGTCTVHFNQAGSGNYNPAPEVINSVTAVPWTFGGFFQPIDNPNVFNVAKAGSTIPVKFSLGGDQGLAILAANYPNSQSIACSATAPADTVEELSTATVSGLKYDPVANQYIYNWKTATNYAGTCRQLNVKLADGTIHTALFKFTK
jgi:hypothetical protein